MEDAIVDLSKYFDLKIIPELFDQLQLNYSVIDRDGNYLIQNNTLIKDFSKGKNKAQEIDPISWNDCLSVIKSGEKKTIEEFFDGKYYLSVKLPLKKNNVGEYQAILIVSIDITEKKKLEKSIQEANASKEQFLSLLGDELKAPLRTILTEAQKLESIINLGQKRWYAQHIIDEATEMSGILDDVVNCVGGYAGKQKLHAPSLFNFKQFLEGVILSHQARAQKRGAFITLDYPSVIPSWIQTDKLSFRKIINYFLTHLLQASKRQEICLSIKNHKQAKQLGFDLIIESRGEVLEDSLSEAILQSSITAGHLSVALVGIEPIQQLISLLEGQCSIDYLPETGLKVDCRFEVNYSKSSPVINYPWSIYQEQIRLLIVDDSARGLVLRQHLGEHNIEVTGTTREIAPILRAAVAMQKPFHIILVGGVHRGKMQEKMALSVGRVARNEKNIVQPLLLLLSDEDSMRLRDEAEGAGFFSVLNPFIGPVALQTELAAAWESWCERRRLQPKDGKMLADSV